MALRMMAMALLATAWAGAAAAQRPQAPRDLPTVPVGAAQGDPMPDRALAFPAGVTAHADVIYSVVPGFRPLRLDVYNQAGAGPRPLVIYIHGGGWVGGHTRAAAAIADFPAALARLAAEGFVVASLEYRLGGEAPHPAQLQDVRAAIRFLKANAVRFGVDASRIALWGGSAGGHLAALAATSCRDASLDPPAAAGQPAPVAGDTCVQAAAIWYGVFDFATLRQGPSLNGPTGLLLRCNGADCPADRLASVSPAHYFSRNDPPFLLVHGLNDRTVPVAQSQLAEAALKANGVPVQAIYIPAVDHSFLGADAATTHAATMQAVNATFNFFHDRLGAAK
ncbi:MAG: alpha/beta hydrolase [Sphingomonadales bacterium]|jgi:acetyl esterase/lipase